MTYVFVAFVSFVALVLVAANLMASVALIRTSDLTRFQKVAQGVIVWLLPFVGAFLVLHLIGQSDREAIPRWIPDPAINRYVLELLGVESKIAERAVEHVVEQAITSGGESAGSDGGH